MISFEDSICFPCKCRLPKAWICFSKLSEFSPFSRGSSMERAPNRWPFESSDKLIAPSASRSKQLNVAWRTSVQIGHQGGETILQWYPNGQVWTLDTTWSTWHRTWYANDLIISKTSLQSPSLSITLKIKSVIIPTLLGRGEQKKRAPPPPSPSIWWRFVNAHLAIKIDFRIDRGRQKLSVTERPGRHKTLEFVHDAALVAWCAGDTSESFLQKQLLQGLHTAQKQGCHCNKYRKSSVPTFFFQHIVSFAKNGDWPCDLVSIPSLYIQKFQPACTKP